MTEGEKDSLETQAEEASKDANVTVDEPTAPALDISPDPNTEWEKAAADSGDDSKASDEDDSDGSDDDASEGDEATSEGDGSQTEDTSDDTDDDSGQS